MTPTEKTCTKCGETKPLDAFYKRKGSPDGRRNDCRDCLNRRTAANYAAKREEKLAQMRRYREENRDAVLAGKRREYWRNRDSHLAAAAEYREQNGDAIRERQRDRYRSDPAYRRSVLDRSRHHYYENREEILEYWSGYREANRDKIAAHREANPHLWWKYGYKKRAEKFGHQVVIEDFTKADVIARYGDGCAYCESGEFEQLDHHVPVSKGGPHTLNNVRPSCASCNKAKSDADGDEWLAEQAELDNLTEDELDDLIDAEIDRWTK